MGSCCGPSFDPDTLYPRNVNLDDDRTVNIYQSETGDVGCVVWDAAIVLAKFYEHMSYMKPEVDSSNSTLPPGDLSKCGYFVPVLFTFSLNFWLSL